MSTPSWVGLSDEDSLALVARARRARLLRIHRHRLSREDLEDCYSQTTLELLGKIRRGGSFSNRSHLSNALEQRFLSRVRDRHRALSGRSPIEAAIAGALALWTDEALGVEISDPRADVQRLVAHRETLREIADALADLSADQRLVLISQLEEVLDCASFCAVHNWSPEKYRKVAQRARARLKRLLGVDEDS